ncbi:uncharacterized protein LOC143040640 [Oratosquilla oratoria]|uniref:uncharacterized protein LOC143040640 n=1 Tax=Oratosquilla oratoria TaxID=337810 RepID=UPI003F773C1D
MTLLRGYLYVDLIEAEDLPDCDTAFFNLDPKDTSDPFAQVSIGSCVVCKTAYINNDLSPKWQESFTIPVCHFADALEIQVKDKDHVNSGHLGTVSIRPEDLMDGETLEGWYPLVGCDGKINLKLNYVPKDQIDMTFEVPNCYFPLQEGCKMKLYQDAHCHGSALESVITPDGEPYQGPCAWKDLYHALNSAQHFIYMTGWSVWTETVLVRKACDDDEEEEGLGETLGELLKRKAEEGVRILIMVWNEKLSTGVTPGLMGTHDEDTCAYFEGTNVEVALVPRMRNLEGLTSFFRDQFAQTCYSHHQKTIILDAPPLEDEELPRVAAFLGGLDVTDGRWDTPEHNLFRTLNNAHQGDFYNNCTQTTSDCGPRQPWHDIHCRIDGPCVVDVLNNFTERWRKQVSDRESRLLPITSEAFALEASAPSENPDDVWNLQLLRSITSDSAVFDFNKIASVPKRKGKYVDDSIHRAYIHHIRRADAFLFIENQYFLGSAYNWDDERHTKAHHLIPLEITEKIIEKISAGEHFVAYVCVPMHPEGDPASQAVQEILHWQHRTMQMMYHHIAKAIEENELDTHPTDYLMFFCLGKGECPDEIPEDLASPEPETPAEMLREKARFMIYVHSKMMIVDDDYIIIGSANINQRSMGGTRDTEIAVGGFQPMHTREVSGNPRGAVHLFRMALWAEHLGSVGEEHLNPGTLECARAVKEAAQSNWENYVKEEPCHIDGHLLMYPVNVEQDGTVTELEDCPNFPDTEAPVIGACNYLPNKLTT